MGDIAQFTSTNYYVQVEQVGQAFARILPASPREVDSSESGCIGRQDSAKGATWAYSCVDITAEMAGFVEIALANFALATLKGCLLQLDRGAPRTTSLRKPS